MENQTSSKHAPPPLAYRTAGGDTVEFQPDPDRMILYARGRRARPQVEDRLARAQIQISPWSPGTAPDQIGVLAHLPDTPRRRRRALAALRQIVERDLPRANLVGRLAAPMRIAGRVDGLTGQLVVRFAPAVAPARVAAIAKRHRLRPVRAVPYAGNCHVLAAPAVPGYELLETLARLAAEPGVAAAEPEVVGVAVTDGADFLLPEQRDLQLIGCPGAWALMPGGAPAGSPSIAVAVIDVDGIDPAHPDLASPLGDGSPKQLANHDLVIGGAQARANLRGPHGTQCAAAAVGGFGNTVGIAGVAGNCHLIGARISETPTTLELADALVWAAGLSTGAALPALARGADVIALSIGSPGPLADVQRAAIDRVTTEGRGGLGCVICCSAGNLGDVDFAGQRAMAAYERTLAIGASVNASPTSPAVRDTRAGYSPHGELDLVAPASTTVGSEPIDPIVAAARAGFGDWIGSAEVAAKLAAEVSPAAPGAPSTTITVDSAAGFAVDMRVLVGVPGAADREFSAIIAASGDQLTLAPPLRNLHAPGTAVAAGRNDYNDRGGLAGGTSHATALVAGAAALVLSARPELTWRDVRAVLRRSAARIDPDRTGPGRWIDRDGDGIAEFSRWYGYGRLDVGAAVRLARATSPSPAERPAGVAGPDAACTLTEPGASLVPVGLGVLGLGGIAALVLALRPCCDEPAPATPVPQACDLPRRAKPDSCPIAGCGSNSQYLSGFLIEGMNLDGCRNYDGVRLVPGSLRRGISACPDVPMTLDLVGGALVGRAAASGDIVCPAGALGGATFTVDGPAAALGLGGSTAVTARALRIRSTGSVEAVNAAGPPETVRTYTFEAAEPGGAPLCQPAAPPAWLVDWTAAAPPATSGEPSPTPAVLVAGELYDPADARAKLSGADVGRWFNVACQGGALSKMRLMGLDPTRPASSSSSERQATLKMITAKYCGATSYTTGGVGLLWTSLAGKTGPLGTPPPGLGPLEAHWTPDGATCISHSRAWRSGQPAPTFAGVPAFATEAGLLELIRTTCGIPACPEVLAPSAAAGAGVYWTTRTVAHIAH